MNTSARRSIPLLTALIAYALFLVLGCGKPESSEGSATKAPSVRQGPAFPFSHNNARQFKIGADACVECHADAVAKWKNSHHGRANRPVSAKNDRAAFTPARRITESGVIYEMAEASPGKFVLRVIDPETEAVSESYDLVGVIGTTPLRQYLAHLPGDKFQTISASYDVLNDQWFDVYQGQDRLPGEWGHWAGQGMNWNSNCAYCHTTEYQKNYDFETDSYHSYWTQQSISCAECHVGVEAHVEAAKRGDYTTGLNKLTKEQTLDNCATCHSRRDQLTADAFELGDRYDDHFSLSTPSQPGLYYHDGQILDEVFVYGSFRMSRMHHKGVHCMDCHDPHSMELTMPVENNMLCMKCHEGGVDGAPVIQPELHSFHPADSTGNRCVECHMVQTNYMQIDPRADHGFHSPDPLMTKELGIPNACNRCHTEETVDWAVDWSERWYGDKLAESRQRMRARALDAAHNFRPEGMEQLFELLEEEDISAWIATYTSLLANYLPNRRVEEQFKSLLDHEAPIVRERATAALAQTQGNNDLLIDQLSDDSRSVRLAAARGLEMSNNLPAETQAAKEFNDYLQFNIDRPQSLMILANRAAREGNVPELKKYLDRAVQFDKLNGEVYRQGAILFSIAGQSETAEAYLKQGWTISPDNAMFPYSLGLLYAERQDLERAVGYLEETVTMQPDFPRAWYNLSLAYQQLNRPEDAQRAMMRAQSGQ
ncbi:multiheme c-type cytochrome [Coraliomargarita akajimensis]|uniref:Cytochrome c family protein n=1 Tax=Coraliomargarita akajimensis (strain DSM 45221 / IAM 15411 / JCM 23193 / KCTC 12865 / 04OKA010-24) TaxID=583355 RepID=D5ENW3_CORAD|nr:tetratricopeptide repeat protein [Coraliomargarita akajimensis]ADE53622.1 cytochrome c family protein [Coraliomargarita akajimensis DSM 45221]